jgi:hypothetical protein
MVNFIGRNTKIAIAAVTIAGVVLAGILGGRYIKVVLQKLGCIKKTDEVKNEKLNGSSNEKKNGKELKKTPPQIDPKIRPFIPPKFEKVLNDAPPHSESTSEGENELSSKKKEEKRDPSPVKEVKKEEAKRDPSPVKEVKKEEAKRDPSPVREVKKEEAKRDPSPVKEVKKEAKDDLEEIELIIPEGVDQPDKPLRRQEVSEANVISLLDVIVANDGSRASTPSSMPDLVPLSSAELESLLRQMPSEVIAPSEVEVKTDAIAQSSLSILSVQNIIDRIAKIQISHNKRHVEAIKLTPPVSNDVSELHAAYLALAALIVDELSPDIAEIDELKKHYSKRLVITLLLNINDEKFEAVKDLLQMILDPSLYDGVRDNLSNVAPIEFLIEMNRLLPKLGVYKDIDIQDFVQHYNGLLNGDLDKASKLLVEYKNIFPGAVENLGNALITKALESESQENIIIAISLASSLKTVSLSPIEKYLKVKLISAAKGDPVEGKDKAKEWLELIYLLPGSTLELLATVFSSFDFQPVEVVSAYNRVLEKKELDANEKEALIADRALFNLLVEADDYCDRHKISPVQPINVDQHWLRFASARILAVKQTEHVNGYNWIKIWNDLSTTIEEYFDEKHNPAVLPLLASNTKFAEWFRDPKNPKSVALILLEGMQEAVKEDCAAETLKDQDPDEFEYFATNGSLALRKLFINIALEDEKTHPKAEWLLSLIEGDEYKERVYSTLLNHYFKTDIARSCSYLDKLPLHIRSNWASYVFINSIRTNFDVAKKAFSHLSDDQKLVDLGKALTFLPIEDSNSLLAKLTSI